MKNDSFDSWIGVSCFFFFFFQSNGSAEVEEPTLRDDSGFSRWTLLNIALRLLSNSLSSIPW